ncbi:efflux RND transporter permease subunit [PVC group bacterium]|nr:efflux RND transporter permease subunit [PVC group bacterium]
MGFVRIAVHRRVATIMVYLGVVLLGFISLTKLPNELFPPIVYPQLTVVTPYPNAAPEEVESLITKKIEEAVGTVRGIKGIRSYSHEGVSMVVADFEWSSDMNFASLNMREKIDLVKGGLPREALEPTVIKFNPFSKPLMVMSVTGNYNESDLLSIVKTLIRDKLEKVEGVAAVSISGGLDRQIIVEVDQLKLTMAGLSLDNVINAIINSNLNYPAGETEDEFYEYLIRTMGEFQSVEEISEVIVGTDDVSERTGRVGEKRLIYLKHVAHVIDTFKEKTSHSRFGLTDTTGKNNSKSNISLSIQKQASGNTIFTSDRIKETLVEIKENLPEGVFMEIVEDQSVYIRKSIRDVVKNGLTGGVLAFFVLLFFIRRIRSSLYVAVTIPVSIMAVMSIMYFSGLTINMMSLGGLVLGIGMLVDNAIVIIENITRHQQELNKSPIDACIEGTEEVSGAVSASTYTTIAVFLPLIYVVGLVGQVFKEVAFTVTFSQIASLIIGLSLIPRLAQNETKAPEKENIFAASARRIVEYMQERYVHYLKKILNHKIIFLLFVIAIFAGSLAMFPLLKKEALPKMDQGKFDIMVTLPKGTTLNVTNRVVTQIEDVIFSTPEVLSVGSIVGSNQDMSLGEATKALGSNEGKLIVMLKDIRGVSTNEVIQGVREKVNQMDVGLAKIEYIAQESIFATGGEESSPIIIEIKGKDYDEMGDIAYEIKANLKTINGVFGIKDSIAEKSPETKIIINKDRASLYDISIKDIAQVAQIAIKGFVATKFKDEGKEIDILVRCRREDVDSLEKLGNIRVKGIPLRELATMVKGKGPSEIVRDEQQRMITVTASIFKRPFNEIASDIETFLSTLVLKENYSVALTGENEQMKQSFDSLKMILILSILFVYMIMAAQFESLWQPFIIMLTVPLAIIGVFLALFFSGVSLNAISMIGLVLLAGIVVNNGIVLIECINANRDKGNDITSVVIDACRSRFRPIIMTMLTTLLGVLPLALGIGGRGEILQPMAVTTFGGLFVSTCLTLGVIPCLFLLTESAMSKLRMTRSGQISS